MKEKIRDWTPRQKIKVKYQVDKTHYAYWETTANALYTHMSAIVDAYMAKDIRLSNRQLYYRLVGKDLIPNFIEMYKRVCTFLTDLRYGGYIDWDAIEDRGRVSERKSQWDTVQDLIRSAISQYRLPRWKGQEYYLELYSEKEAMDSVLRPIAEKYHIYFGYNKGYTSASAIHELAARVMRQIENKKKIIILYLGDHDPSGLDMVRDINKRIREFLTAWIEKSEWGSVMSDMEIEYFLDENFSVVHVALTSAQVAQYNPPPNPAKFSDPRATNYIATHGETSWELDSLEPEVLIQLTEDAILNYLDVEKYNRWIKQEAEEKKLLKRFGDSLKKKKRKKSKKHEKKQ